MADRARMTELYLLRHAHAGDPADWSGSDARRPLSQKGERQAERLAEFLAGASFAADVFITSPKVRAARTAEIVASSLGVEVRLDERLAGGVEIATLEAILDDAGDPARVAFVGHDPDFSDLLATLIGARELPMKKGALARIDTVRPLSSGSGKLRWLVPPDLLRRG